MDTKPFYTPQSEVDFFDAINEELIDQIANQAVDIYKISVDDTTDNIYGESSTKYFESAFRVNCLIAFEEVSIEQEGIGPDMTGNIELYFHRTTLREANFMPEMGDICDWNNFYWEINAITEPQLIGGYQAFSHMVKATAHMMRQSQLQIEERRR